jgi:metal-responsive CopG/Arc/MetJ family transcriptional regulator
MASVERVTVTLADDLVRDIDRREKEPQQVRRGSCAP